MKKYFFFTVAFFVIVVVTIIFFPNTKKNTLSYSDIKPSIFYSNQENVSKFDELVEEINSKTGTYSIYIKDLSHNETYKFNEDYPLYAASLFKVPVAVSVLKSIEMGVFSLDDQKPYLAIDYATGTGIINQYPYGKNFTIYELLSYLLKDSDNSAQNVFLRIVPPEILANTFKISNDLNFFYQINVASSKQIAGFFEALIKKEYINDDYKYILYDLMSTTSFDDRVNKGLDDNLTFAHKIGNWGDTGSWHDCGIVSREIPKVIVCVMSESTNYEDFVSVSEKVGQFISVIINK